MLEALVMVCAGGLIGWAASLVMNRDASMGVLANVLVGCAGAALGRFVIAIVPSLPPLGKDPFSPLSLLVSLGGAVTLLAIANLIQRGRLR